MTRILCPTDFSETAIHVTGYAEGNGKIMGREKRSGKYCLVVTGSVVCRK
jgi:hypothetical protein